ncbi:fibronectin-binding protein A N-terminus-domain-containing protein [Stachybotrys elegans]|uniref:Ribosome quality control complex subunit 2 n=1 Tax=Stachybotrys elegans TaxID=80388 RepID=A0A8K0SSS1_9HYPO|nr:fibronectin-binding protein A N-terminus-domain-containing protein [Stachybotrys elegans]
MKQRFSSLDVKVIAHELQQTLVTLRLSNAYDLSSKILLLKFAKPDNKQQLVIDTGFRCHLTDFARTTAAAPSAFVARLRKYLKTRRLTSVAQVGTDRILEFQFSDGQYRLFLEFFASGNIILTDTDLKILAIARNVSEGEGQEQQRVGLQYSLDNRQNYPGVPALTKERVKNALAVAVEKASQAVSDKKKLKAKPGGDLRKSLATSITELPPVLVDHVLQSNNFDTSVKPAELLENDSLLEELVKSLSEAREVVEAITSSPICSGYIFAKRKILGAPVSQEEGENSKRENLLYDDFHPFVPKKLKEDPSVEVLEFEGYNRTVDEFFSSLEGQKLESRLAERELAAKRKLEAAKQDQAKRIEGLQETQTLNLRKAAAIEANVERVQEAMDAVNGLLAQGMDWIDIGKLVEREKKRHNPVAETIQLPMNLSENLITLMLAEEEYEVEQEDDPFETDESDTEVEEDEDDVKSSKPGTKGLTVEINLTLSPWANAREYYEQKRSAAVKEEKTQLQATRALKNAEQKITEDLKKGLKQEKAVLQPIRKPMWFEKFIWFISSDGYLVLGGKDAAQNEILYKRYLRKGDVYCHADLHGAPTVIIKNNPKTPDAPIPPATLSQAGSLSVCSSSAWDSKAGMGAWWVNADQVSKSAPTGEFLPPGSFMVRGKKNFLPPAPLLLGLGFMFKISEESKAKHVKHRLYDDSLAGAPSTSIDKGDTALQGEASRKDDSYNNSDDEDDPSEHGSAEHENQDNVPRDNPLQPSTDEGEEGEDEGDEGHEADIPTMEELTIDEQNKSQDEDAGPAKNEEEDDDNKDSASETTAETSLSTMSLETDTTTSTASITPEPKAKPAKRGQKGKAKRIANKYKYQDEEDRAAAEALIGATLGQQRAAAEAKAKAEREAEAAAAKERRRAQHQRQQKEMAKHEEIRRVMMDEGLDMLEGDEAEQATPLDALVGTPLPGDEILEVIPVCAPWNALVKFKYKAKLQPGSVKKGKAVKEVLDRTKAASAKKGVVDEHARDSERMWPREVELIKALKPEEVHNCIPVGKVRVMVAGGSSSGGGGDSKGKGGKGPGKGGRGGKGSKRS